MHSGIVQKKYEKFRRTICLSQSGEGLSRLESTCRDLATEGMSPQVLRKSGDDTRRLANNGRGINTVRSTDLPGGDQEFGIKFGIHSFSISLETRKKTDTERLIVMQYSLNMVNCTARYLRHLCLVRVPPSATVFIPSFIHECPAHFARSLLPANRG